MNIKFWRIVLSVFIALNLVLPILPVVKAADPLAGVGIMLDRISVSGSYTASSSQAITAYFTPTNSIAAGNNSVKLTFPAQTGSFAVNATASNIPTSAGTNSWSTSSSTNTTISNASGDQTSPISISDGSGGVIFVWKDTRNGNNDIYAQRVNSNGDVQWTANGVAIVTNSSSQILPAIATDGAGGAIIVWTDFRNHATNGDLYAQWINSSGSVQWAANGVRLTTTGGLRSSANQFDMNVLTDGSGGAFITWTDVRNGTSNRDIYAQRIDSSGAALWTANGVVIVNASNGQYAPVLVTDGASGAIIAWLDIRPGITTWNIFAQRINSSGSVQWTANGVRITATTTWGVYDYGLWPPPIGIISDGSNGAIFGWTESSEAGNDVSAQRVNGSGALQWGGGTSPVTIASGGLTFRSPLVVSDGSGGAIFGWINASSPKVLAQKINSSGSTQWTSGGITIANNQNLETAATSTLLADGVSGAYITYLQYVDASQHDNVLAQRINSSGSLQWNSNGITVTSKTGADARTTTVLGSNGNLILGWDNNGTDIYAQSLTSSGTLGYTAGPTLPSTIGETNVTALSSIGTASTTTGDGTANTGGAVTLPFAGALTAGTLYAFNIVGGITTPTSVGQFEIIINTYNSSSVNIDSGTTEVAIISNDQFSVTAAVDSIFTLTAGDMDVTFSGDLNPTNVVSSNGSSDTLGIATNATSGYEVLLKATNATGLASAKNGGAGLAESTIERTGTVNNIPDTLVAGTEGYVIDVDGTNSGTGNGDITIDPEYNGTDTSSGGTPSSTYERVASSNGTTDGDTLTFYARAAVSAVTPAADDYTDTWTIMAHGLF